MKKILIVDDEPDILDSLKTTLERQKAPCHHGEGRGGGLKIAERESRI